MTTESAPISREDFARAIFEKHKPRFLYKDHQLFKQGDFVALAENLRRSSRRAWWVLLVVGLFLLGGGILGLAQGTGGLFNLIFGVVLLVQGALQHQRVQATCDIASELFPDYSPPSSPPDSVPVEQDVKRARETPIQAPR